MTDQIEDEIIADLHDTLTDSIRDCLEELGDVDYASCIDHWQQIYLDDLDEKYPVYFETGGMEYRGATITILDHEFDLEEEYEAILADLEYAEETDDEF